ncbi:OsmC family protein [Sporosarcina sp. FSL K6-2383]|uniref:OsmC family protein n=1 Tax=Sporosarcina sp. FSL K6-2383 TaxID=2921556 RepID=UPI00315AA2CE
MTIINKINGVNGIYNEAGLQLEGSLAPNLNGLSPRELLEASLGLCVSISLQKMFERDNIVVEDQDISIEVVASKEENITTRFGKFDVSIAFPEHFTEEYKQKLIISVERACTIGNTLKNGVTIHTVEKAE